MQGGGAVFALDELARRRIFMLLFSSRLGIFSSPWVALHTPAASTWYSTKGTGSMRYSTNIFFIQSINHPQAIQLTSIQLFITSTGMQLRNFHYESAIMQLLLCSFCFALCNSHKYYPQQVCNYAIPAITSGPVVLVVDQ